MPQIELLGLARRYAGADRAHCEGTTLAEILRDLGNRFPTFAAHCSAGELLPTGLIVCVNERRFITNLSEPIVPTDRLLILSADVGG